MLTLVELEYGLIASAPPVGASVSGVSVNPAAADATLALSIALTDSAPPPLDEPSKVTSTRLPVWIAAAKPPSTVNE